MLRTRFAGLVVGAMVALPGCGVTVRTQPPSQGGGCLLSALEGKLKSDPFEGVGIEWEGKFYAVVWPHGYSASRDSTGTVQLLDRQGTILAREGDTIVLAGRMAADGLARTCDPPDLKVIATPAAAGPQWWRLSSLT